MLNTFFLAAALAAPASFADRSALQKELNTIAAASDGKVGVCALETPEAEPVCVRGTERFPLQSVMKFIVSAVVLHEVDQNRLKLTDVIRVKPEDNSPGPQEFADLVRAKGEYPATIEELMRRSIVDSDSTSVDVLLQRIGGIAKVQEFLQQRKVDGLRIDRNERDLQAEFSGLKWQASYAPAGKFEAAVQAAPPAQKDQALEAYLKDPRDTSTPAAMVKFLKRLAAGELLSAASTQKLLSIMEQTVTGKDRLRAGLPQSWKIAHKTGTSASWRGRAATTNDVGIMTAPDGTTVAIAVFIADSKQSSSERGAIIAKAARAVTAAFQGTRQKS
jgi:beta-lactamase class A